MSIKCAFFISSALILGHILAVNCEDSARKSKFLDISGYLSGNLSAETFSNRLNSCDEEKICSNWRSHHNKGSSDHQLVPFLRQWNALLQVNIEKHKQKHNGYYVVPTSAFYYPPYDGYGFYVPHHFGGFHANHLRPTPFLFDEFKIPTTTLVWSIHWTQCNNATLPN